MAQRGVIWSAVVLAGALLGASAPWSRVPPACNELPAAEREAARVAGRCEGRAPIVNVAPGAARPGEVRAARVPVPDLRGRLFNRQDERLGRFIVLVDYRESAQRRDWVLDQVPRPPAALPVGADLRVILSDGALVRVPDVRGGLARALALLHRSGLTWSNADGNGRVIGQAPPAGTAVRPGTRVELKFKPAQLALAPESTRPDVAPPPARPPATAPAPPSAAPPAGTGSPPATPAPPGKAPAAPGVTAPGSITMPDLLGMAFDAARARLQGVDVQRVHRAGTEPGGTVIGQTPPAGAMVAPGTTVRLVLSDGSLVRVPRVMSFTLSEARLRLAPTELRPVITNVPSDAPAGTVVSQQPAEGQFAERGSTVRIAVSSGPAPKQALTMPGLVGVPFDRARGQLGAFKVERSERAAREPVGTILEQLPAAGAKIEPGATVSIIVSSGGRPEVIEVANVAGQSADVAARTLSEFRVEREAMASVEPAGRVLGQEPAPGTTLAPGATVRLRVSDGSLVRAPDVTRMTVAQARDVGRAAGLEVEVAGEGDDDAHVVRQTPVSGAVVGRGSALSLAVEPRMLPFSLPPQARDAWTRIATSTVQLPSRTLAMIAVALLAVLALLIVAVRRARATRAVIEPVFVPPEPTPPSRRAAVDAPPTAPFPAVPRASAAPAARDVSPQVMRTRADAARKPAGAAPRARPVPPIPASIAATPAASGPDTSSPDADAPIGAPPSAAPADRGPPPVSIAPTAGAVERPAVMRRPAAGPRVYEAPPAPPPFAPPVAATAAPPLDRATPAREAGVPPRGAPASMQRADVAPARPKTPLPAATAGGRPAMSAAPGAVRIYQAPPESRADAPSRAPSQTPAPAAAVEPQVVPASLVGQPIVVAATPLPVIDRATPDPVVFSATARLDSDPAATRSPNAAPRGPEIRIGARLDAGECGVRELARSAATDERTDEVSEESK
jgi:beta-lactam-binding protein with PASTA domain